MLRCKLGCFRPSGTKVFNSHYHCCICGAICIRKSGVYEHMRVNHSVQPISKESLSQLPQNQRAKAEATPPKPVVVQVPSSVPSGSAGPGTQQIQQTQPQTPPSQGVVTGASASPQTVTVQIPAQSYADAQAQGQQQVVILMPQQLNQNPVQSPVQAQQPIVIVMPQTGGGQVAQPIVVPVPQAPSS